MIKAMLKKVWHALLQLRPKKVVKATIVNVSHDRLLAGKTAFITGGTSGIGLAIARAFLQAGASVVIAARGKEKLDNTVTALSSVLKEGQAIKSVVLDCANVASFDSVLNEAEKSLRCKCFDILVNNAGTGGGVWGHCSESDYDKVMNTNLKGFFFLSQSVATRMRATGVKGNILNIASSSSLRPANSAYTLSKWGIRGLTVGLAKTLIKYGIVVNGIAPGPTATPMLSHDSNDINLPTNPSGRFALPEEIASFAVMLCSDAGRMVVGDVLYMTGGSGVTTFDDLNYDF